MRLGTEEWVVVGFGWELFGQRLLKDLGDAEPGKPARPG